MNPQEHNPESMAQDPTGAAPSASPAPPPYPEPAQRWAAPPPRSNDPRRKSVTLATVLSFLPGLGQIYVGNYTRGFVHGLAFAAIITMLAADAGPMTPFLGIGLAFFWFYNVIDAGRRAGLYNQFLDAQSTGQVPSDIEIPGGRGSFLGGIALMVLGAIFLGYTRFDFDMRWLEEWWPAGLILVGAYLFAKDRQARTESAKKEEQR